MGTGTIENAPVHDHHGQGSSEFLEYSTEDGSLRIIGFWVFLAAEVVLFSCLFATYILYHGQTAGGPTSKQLFDVPGFAIETILLLTSSFTYGIATYFMRKMNKTAVVGWLIFTALLGMGFVGMEISEFTTYVGQGATMQTSAFLTAFYTLVGTHGAHVSLGILWMIAVIIQVAIRGIDNMTSRKVFIVGLYWHFLDVVWVFIFTVVYLTGKVL
ncbi:cytochrome aa3 quinol oxidase subunit III [Alicyclobacillus sp. SO9]|uniref:cytochrome aa3 quinol oxidase subunit III n=1 Tax=Alicyclobacillus sp. SO9 TaxID=2665646 RepID=UPI0018E874BF|nr:cytochrome aa3 quinol oxidase subunit III [Alicyclobacillus sp. SO9]QQE79098.1 cytochrome aa3 quinol oxidase subunit III [Alicyclobacillus sp. SO9]